MALAREALGFLVLMTFAGLGLFGAALIVEVVELALTWKRQMSSDAIRQRLGRWAQLRRYAMWWICTAVLWTLTVFASTRGL